MKLKQPLIYFVISTSLIGCGGSSNNAASSDGDTNTSIDPSEPSFAVSRFGANSATIDNRYLPFEPGTGFSYAGMNEDGEMETVEIFVSHETRLIQGIESRVVVDRAYVDGELEEETFDWYAQDTDGNVWYMGEDSKEYEDDEAVSSDGSWESGQDVAGIGQVAVAGIVMKTSFQVGDTYQQEYYPGEAEDMAEIFALDVPISLSDGTNYTALQTKEWVPLDPEGQVEFKYYAEGIGLVLETKEDGSESIELISRADDKLPDIGPEDFSNPTMINNEYFPLIPGTKTTFSVETEDGLETIVIEVTEDTKEVMGITSRVVRDRVYLDGLIIEDTRDWFAQDDDGNVWYMGEEVDNYNYDEEGNLEEIDHEGAWEAGIDGAQPGIQMHAEPRVGDSYRQEYFAGEAEDLAYIVAFDIEVVLASGATYRCLKTKDWNPLEEDAIEYKYYAPNVGLVLEVDSEEDERVELISIELPE